jgi:hypothetical protein
MISTSGVLQQIVERENMPAGTYTLSWTGTATGRVYNAGATPPVYADSPIIVSLDGSANVVVEFTAAGGTRTLGTVQLEGGNVFSPFEYRHRQQELALCQRYYYRTLGGLAGLFLGTGWANSIGTAFNATFQLKVSMRAIPTIGIVGTLTGFDITTQRTITAISSTRGSTEIASGDPSYSGGTFNANRAMFYFAEVGINGVEFRAEL